MSQPTSQALTAPPQSELAAIQAAFAAQVAEAARDLGIGADAGRRLADQVIARVGEGRRLTTGQVAEMLRVMAGRAGVAASRPLPEEQIEQLARAYGRGRRRSKKMSYREARRRSVSNVLTARVTEIMRASIDAIDAAAVEAVGGVAGVDIDKVPLDQQVGPSVGEGERIRRHMNTAKRRWQHLPYEDFSSRMRVESARIASDEVANRFRDTQQRLIFAHPDVDGWRRRAHPGACLACLALADGTVFTRPTLFESHSRCKCTLEPVTADSPPMVTGQQQWDALTFEQKAERLRGRGGEAKAKELENRPLEDAIGRPYGPDSAVVSERTFADLTGN